MSEQTEDDFLWSKLYDCALNLNGVQMYALTLRLVADLATPQDQINIRIRGKINRASQSVKVGTCRVMLAFAPSEAQIATIDLAVATSIPIVVAEYGITMTEYQSWLTSHFVGEQVFVADQIRNGGAAVGVWCFKSSKKTIRRVHDNELVYTDPT